MIDWDLSTSHRPSDVGFSPNGDLDAEIIEDVDSVRIALPEGRTFQAAGDIHDVTVGNDGDSLTLVAVEFQPEGVEDAYRRAVALAEEWDMPTRNIERWYRTARDEGDLAPIERTHSAEFLGGRDGPQPSLEIRPFDQDAPALVSFQLHWRP
jgi:hypothetical protein